MDIQIGQTWRDKDKRRPKSGIIVDFDADEVQVRIEGTDEIRPYARHRFVTRWEHVVPAEAPITHDTREAWLQAAVDLLASKVFEPVNLTVPKVRVSVGWPGGRGPKKNTIGQCFPTHSAGDKVSQIFISPKLEEPIQVIATLVHELVHAVDDCKSGHKKEFVAYAKQVGLTGKWTATVAGEHLSETLKGIYEQLGGYPHSALHETSRPVVQKTYMLKVVCVEDPDYFVRMTKGKLEEYGAPKCPCHDETMELEEA